ncbi:MAG: Mrp/NBP35 family ATP-binding protein [Lachnospiraceae bacterium]|jgi:Mrp family chromosome partitioning ATPase|nr:Mrp/NBP35 family ATP-binding protein [Lachnospiraceae bacterium]MEE3357876.1 Mrp/NBP35 family ATP-binding protein [Lachnospiraceae bacterium]
MAEEKKHLTPEERAARIKRTTPQPKQEERVPDHSGNGPIFAEEANPHSHVKHVIGIVSGKGGVGKSFVTASLANKMAREGKKTAIMDADITGPSIPKMFGVHGPVTGTEDGAYPVEAEDGTKIISMNLMLDHDEDPVVWRGPVVAGVVKQFWTDIMWGDVDYMFVDMPPGTGDVPLTVFQSLPVDGIIIVTSPQDLVSMIVKKAINMAGMMNIPVLGLVENYSYLECPDCGKHINLFGESHIDEIAKEYDLPILGKMPLDPKNAALADAGKIYENDNTYLNPAVEVLKSLEEM